MAKWETKWGGEDSQDVGLEAATIQRKRNSSLVQSPCAENVSGLKPCTEATGNERLTKTDRRRYNAGGTIKTMLQKITQFLKAAGGRVVDALGPVFDILLVAIGIFVLFLLSKAGLVVSNFLGDGGWGFTLAYLIGWGVFFAACLAAVIFSRRCGFFRFLAGKFRGK